MNKKISLILLILFFIIQISVPTSLIAYEKYEEKLLTENGETFRFRINNIRFINNNLLSFSVDLGDRTNTCDYVIVTQTEEFYADCEFSDTIPEGITNYIRTAPKKDGYPFSYNGPVLETEKYNNLNDLVFLKQTSIFKLQNDGKFIYYDNAYMEAKVYNGKSVTTKVVIDGKDSAIYLSDLSREFAE